MKVHVIVVAAVAAALSLGTQAARAAVLSVSALNSPVTVGTPLEVAISISGLGDGVTPSLGAYDIELSFDDSVLAFSSVVFGDPVLGDQLEFVFPSFQGSGPGAGVSVNIFQVSLDDPLDIIALQAPSFVLAILTFDTLGAGVSPLTLAINALGDEDADPLAADIVNGSATVQLVPEPSITLLMFVALYGCLRQRRR